MPPPPRSVPVVLQGSVVEPAAAAGPGRRVADLVEMTRAQIADARPGRCCGRPPRAGPALPPVQPGVPGPRQPQPAGHAAWAIRAGHETTEPERRRGRPTGAGAAHAGRLVVGGGPAGLECARVAAAAGHRSGWPNAAPGLAACCRAAAVGPGAAADGPAGRLAGGGVPPARRDRGTGTPSRRRPRRRPGRRDRGRPGHRLAAGAAAAPAAPAVDALAALSGRDLPAGPAVVHDPVGGPVGVGMAEWLAASLAGR